MNQPFKKCEKQLRIEFPSTLTNVELAVKHASDFIESQAKTIDPFELKLVLCEGITNAVVHGNKENEKLSTFFTVQINEKEVHIIFKDLGKGFNWHDKLNTNMDDLYAQSGRGLALMKNYGYKVTFNKIGNIMHVRKKL